MNTPADSREPLKIFELTFDQLTGDFKKRYRKGSYHSAAVYREIFKKGNRSLRNSPEFEKSESLRERVLADMVFPNTFISDFLSCDGVMKFGTVFEDGNKVESVIIPMLNYNTLCVSSQVGCRLNCKFCTTGKMGFSRNLSVGEIVSQVYNAIFVLKQDIKNVVFMGMGEPFDNFENVIQAIRVLNDQRGLDFAHRHITVSTAGLTEGIGKLGEKGWKNVNLAVSLNAPNNDIRSRLMPVNRKYPMEELRRSLQNYPLRKNGSYLVEYVLIKGVNDSEENARELAGFLSGLPVRLNVIPYNTDVSETFVSPSDEEVHRFSSYLEEEGVFVRKRWRKGEGLLAGCGQLGDKVRDDESGTMENARLKQTEVKDTFISDF